MQLEQAIQEVNDYLEYIEINGNASFARLPSEDALKTLLSKSLENRDVIHGENHNAWRLVDNNVPKIKDMYQCLCLRADGEREIIDLYWDGKVWIDLSALSVFQKYTVTNKDGRRIYRDEKTYRKDVFAWRYRISESIAKEKIGEERKNYESH